MIPLSATAATALEALTDHYAALGRDRAIDRLIEAVEMASQAYEQRGRDILAAPRPYPSLADLGFRWIKRASYWIAFEDTAAGPVVAGIFHETADIPNRL